MDKQPEFKKVEDGFVLFWMMIESASQYKNSNGMLFVWDEEFNEIANRHGNWAAVYGVEQKG